MVARAMEINTSALKADVNAINQELRAIKAASRQLSETAVQLGRTWDGDAKDAFMRSTQSDILKLEELIAMLESFTQTTGDSRLQYERCEGTVSQIVSSIRI